MARGASKHRRRWESPNWIMKAIGQARLPRLNFIVRKGPESRSELFALKCPRVPLWGPPSHEGAKSQVTSHVPRMDGFLTICGWILRFASIVPSGAAPVTDGATRTRATVETVGGAQRTRLHWEMVSATSSRQQVSRRRASPCTGWGGEGRSGRSVSVGRGVFGWSFRF